MKSELEALEDSPNQDKYLGRYFANLPLVDSERERLLQQLGKESLAKKILNKYGNQTHAYKTYEKIVQIPGFRPGTERYFKQAQHRMLAEMRKLESNEYEISWKIYQSAAILFVIAEMGKLNTLLQEVKEFDSNISSEDLLQRICSNAYEFNVPPTDVQEFYEFWWIARTDNFTSLLKLCLRPSEISLLNKKLSKILIRNEELESEISDIATDLGKLTNIISEQQLGLQNSAKQIKSQQAHLLSLQEELTTTRQSFKDYFDNSDEKLSSAITALNQSISSDVHKQTHTATNEIFVEKFSDLRKQTAKEQQESFDKLAQQISTTENTIANVAAELNAKMERYILDATNSFSDSRNKAVYQEPYKSPLAKLNVLTPQSPQISSQVEFLSSWSETILRKHDWLIPIEQLLAFHVTFLGSRITICHHELVSTWLECLNWRKSVRVITPSPLWSAETDWADSANFLFDNNADSKYPKILLIYNYDVAMVDCYLVPTLMLWSLTRATSPSTKIILVPSILDTKPQSLLLEHTSMIEKYDPEYETGLVLEQAIDLIPISGSIPTGVSPELFEQWASGSSAKVFSTLPLRNSFQFSLSPWVMRDYENLVSVAGKFFKPSSSAGIGIYHRILPLLRAKLPAEELYALKTHLADSEDIVF